MGRKKIDKDTIDYLSNSLFYKEGFKGFQLTTGNTPLGIEEDRPLEVSVHLNIENKSNVVIDSAEFELKDKIYKYLFPENYILTRENLKNLTDIFNKLGYETDSIDNYAGEWYWFRIKCNIDEIKTHLDILKENIKL